MEGTTTLFGYGLTDVSRLVGKRPCYSNEVVPITVAVAMTRLPPGTLGFAATALLTVLLAFGASPVAAQNWSFDARRIALGSIGDTGNVASELVAERRGYGSIVVPFGLFQILDDFSIYDPGDDNFDPVRAAEYIASPLHYTFDRKGSDSGQQFVNDIVNGRLNPNLNVYRGFQPANEFFGEGLASPSWGKTFTVRENSAGAFHGVYVGAGPYLSVRTDNMIDQGGLD